jgi:hypothetical protein
MTALSLCAALQRRLDDAVRGPGPAAPAPTLRDLDERFQRVTGRDDSLLARPRVDDAPLSEEEQIAQLIAQTQDAVRLERATGAPAADADAEADADADAASASASASASDADASPTDSASDGERSRPRGGGGGHSGGRGRRGGRGGRAAGGAAGCAVS